MIIPNGHPKILAINVWQQMMRIRRLLKKHRIDAIDDHCVFEKIARAVEMESFAKIACTSVVDDLVGCVCSEEFDSLRYPNEYHWYSEEKSCFNNDRILIAASELSDELMTVSTEVLEILKHLKLYKKDGELPYEYVLYIPTGIIVFEYTGGMGF